MATIRERKGKTSTTYMAEVRLKGYPPQTATFKRITDAKKWVQQTEAAIREGRYFKTAESRKRTLGDLIEKYLTERLHLRGDDKETVGPHLKWWDSQIGAYTLADITPALIAEHRDMLLNEPMNGKKNLTNATVIRYLASLSVCLTYGIEDLDWLETNPVRQVRKPKPEKGRVRFLSSEEREALLRACKASSNRYLLPIVIIALSTGARLSEITGLCWKDVDLHKRRITFNETKNGERRTVLLSKNAYELFQDLSKVRRIDTDYLFPRADGKKPLEIRKAWERTIKESGIEDFRFHDLRHTAASYLAMSGASLMEISAILGHRTMQMVKRYAHLTEQHTSEVVERMNTQYLAGSN